MKANVLSISMHFKERRHEIAKKNDRIFTRFTFITIGINLGCFISDTTITGCFIIVIVVITDDADIGNATERHCYRSKWILNNSAR